MNVGSSCVYVGLVTATSTAGISVDFQTVICTQQCH